MIRYIRNAGNQEPKTHHATPAHTSPHCNTPHYTTTHQTTPHHTKPQQTTSHHTPPHHTQPNHSKPRHTTPLHTTPHHNTPHHFTPHHVTHQFNPSIPTSQCSCLTQFPHYDISEVIWPDSSTKCDVRTAIAGIKWPADRRSCFCSNFSVLLSSFPYQHSLSTDCTWMVESLNIHDGKFPNVTVVV